MRFFVAALAAFFVSCASAPLPRPFTAPYAACYETARKGKLPLHDVGMVVGQTEEQGVISYRFQSSYYDGRVIDVAKINRRCRIVTGASAFVSPDQTRRADPHEKPAELGSEITGKKRGDQ